jgi:hypothetical protein
MRGLTRENSNHDTLRSMTLTSDETTPPRVVSYPSETIRSIPKFSFVLPSEWVCAEVPDALLLAGTPAEWEERWANILLQHSRESMPFSLEDAAKSSWGLELALSPDATIVDEQVVATRHRIIYMRAAAYPSIGDAAPIGQAQMIFFGPEVNHPTMDVFKLTCLAPESELKSFMPEIFDVAASFRFDADPEVPPLDAAAKEDPLAS